MLRFEQRTAPLPGDGAVTLVERLLQIGDLGKGRLQLDVLILGRLHGLLTAPVSPCRVSSAVATSAFRRSTSA